MTSCEPESQANRVKDLSTQPLDEKTTNGNDGVDDDALMVSNKWVDNIPALARPDRAVLNPKPETGMGRSCRGRTCYESIVDSDGSKCMVFIL